MFRIDQVDLGQGELGISRTDGLPNGNKVTLTYVGTGTFRPRLLWVPPEDAGAVSTLAVTGNSKVWEFSPTPGVYGTYRIEGIENEGTSRERREVRTFTIRTPSGLVIPAYGERSNALMNLQNAPGATGPAGATAAQADNNSIDYTTGALSNVPYAGSWRATTEWIFKLDAMQSTVTTLVPTAIPETALGTGSAWIDLALLAAPALDAGIVTLEYHVFGKYLSSASFVARGTVTVQRISGTSAVLNSVPEIANARVRVAVSGSDILLQAQQHATQDWSFSGHWKRTENL